MQTRQQQIEQWRAALDPHLLRRLLRPIMCPGVIGSEFGKQMILRLQGMLGELTLMKRLQRYLDENEHGWGDVPIVHPRPSRTEAVIPQSTFHAYTSKHVVVRPTVVQQTIVHTAPVSLSSAAVQERPIVRGRALDHMRPPSSIQVEQHLSASVVEHMVSTTYVRIEQHVPALMVQAPERLELIQGQHVTPLVVAQTEHVDTHDDLPASSVNPNVSPSVVPPQSTAKGQVVSGEVQQIVVQPVRQLEHARNAIILPPARRQRRTEEGVLLPVQEVQSYANPLVVATTEPTPIAQPARPQGSEPHPVVLPVQEVQTYVNPLVVVATEPTKPITQSPKVPPFEEVTTNNQVHPSSAQPSRPQEPEPRPVVTPMSAPQYSSVGVTPLTRSAGSTKISQPLTLIVNAVNAVTYDVPQPVHLRSIVSQIMGEPAAGQTHLLAQQQRNGASSTSIVAQPVVAAIMPSAPSEASVPVPAQHQLDVDIVVDKALRKLMRRLDVESERKGWPR